MRQRETDLVVVGAGIIGLAVAYESLRRGRRVLVLERDVVGAGAAGVAAGMLAPAAEADTASAALVDFAVASCASYPEFVAALEADSGMSCGYREEGTLFVAINRDHVEELERLAAFQARFGLPVAWLTPDELLALEPSLSPRVSCGISSPGDRQVDPRRLLRALDVAVASRGGDVQAGGDVSEIERKAGRVVGVRYLQGREEQFVATSQVVVAGGAWARKLVERDVPSLPLRPVKGQILRLFGEPLLRHVVRTPDVYLVPRENGELVVGATSEEQGFDRTVTARGTRELLTEAWRVLPGSEELELREMSANLRPALRDGMPAIGPSITSGLYVAIGHYRHGVMLAPATARLLCDAMCSGQVPSLLAPFQLTRFGAPQVPMEVL